MVAEKQIVDLRWVEHIITQAAAAAPSDDTNDNAEGKMVLTARRAGGGVDKGDDMTTTRDSRRRVSARSQVDAAASSRRIRVPILTGQVIEACGGGGSFEGDAQKALQGLQGPQGQQGLQAGGCVVTRVLRLREEKKRRGYMRSCVARCWAAVCRCEST